MKKFSNIECTKTTRMQKLTVFYLLLYPIISIYGWPGFGFGFISSVLLVGYYMFNRLSRNNNISTNKVPKLLWLYLFYWLFTSLIHAQSLSEFIPLGILLTLFLCLIYYEEIKGDYFVK